MLKLFDVCTSVIYVKNIEWTVFLNCDRSIICVGYNSNCFIENIPYTF